MRLYLVCPLNAKSRMTTHSPSTAHNNKSRFVKHLHVLLVVFIIYENLDNGKIFGATFLRMQSQGIDGYSVYMLV